MSFMKRPKAPNPGPQLKRDHGGNLDQEDATKVNQELLAKFLTEKRLHEKEDSFHVVKGNKRDLSVHLGVWRTNKVDGHTVVGEEETEINQWCFVLPASAYPISNAKIIKAFSELCHMGKQQLMKMGMVKPE